MQEVKSLDETTSDVVPVTIAIGDKGNLTFQVARSGDRGACFCLGVRKSGSTMLHKIVHFLARHNGVNAVDVPGTFFKNGFNVSDWVNADLSEVVRPNNVYLGFRSFPVNFTNYEIFRGGQKIFMFRDPRDALVSQYFSDAYSHSLPSAKTETGAKASEEFLKKRADALATDIDAYVLKHARNFQNTLLAFKDVLEDPTCLTLRYEDYIFQKKRLIHKILKHFDWSLPPGKVEALLGQIDAVPNAEDKTKFVRRVIPGDHRNKLQPETIRRLNNQMRDAMALYDYY
ncbi:sulfotransferase domain-containing protein [Roseomonas populi]|uniref:Sulfotransferase domain-containing protein n=1 Tax=Roseomonas populi TaxID=3121582 RepID=A0ABT1X6E9_9PROT|nr:sulfotransferase domain-containing protein [Roseomonas pecuniae]MCR0983685.1 sulfotransferase domain-containing protein [Roseomonas pecuniae]